MTITSPATTSLTSISNTWTQPSGRCCSLSGGWSILHLRRSGMQGGDLEGSRHSSIGLRQNLNPQLICLRLADDRRPTTDDLISSFCLSDFLVDWFAAGEAFVGAVPVGDSGFSQLP